MNNTELQTAIRELPVSPSERKTALALARSPNPIWLVLAVGMVLLAILHLHDGLDGIAFVNHGPPIGAAPIPALDAFCRARQVQSFYWGVCELVFGLCYFGFYYSAVRQHRLMRVLVSRVIEPKCP